MASAGLILIVANATSGRGRGARTANEVGANLRARGLRIEIRYTTRSGDAERITREVCNDRRVRRRYTSSATRPDCVVACGGDGTVQEVANALASLEGTPGCNPPVMGLAPAGRCNDFARVLGVPSDPSGMAEVLACGEPCPVDLGRVNDRYFCTVVTVGVDAEVSRFVDSMQMPLTGTLAYLYGALRVLGCYRPRRLRISGDFGVIDQPLFLASCANTSSYGGAIRIAPQALPTDGQLDLCVIESVSRLRMLTLVPKVLAGKHRGQPEVRFIRTRQMCIEAGEPLELWADGERIARTPAAIEAAPQAVRVMQKKGHSTFSKNSNQPGRPGAPRFSTDRRHRQSSNPGAFDGP